MNIKINNNNNNFYIILMNIVNEYKYQIYIIYNQGKTYEVWKKNRENKTLKTGTENRTNIPAFNMIKKQLKRKNIKT